MKPNSIRSQGSSFTNSQNRLVEPKKDDSGLLLIMIGVGLIVVLGAYLFETRRQKIELKAVEQAMVTTRERNQMEISVNRHIQMTNRKIETDQEKVRQDARFSIPKVGEVIQAIEEGASGLGMQDDKSEGNVARDLQARRGDRGQTNSVGSVIQNEIAAQQEYQRRLKAANAQYAKEFVENAKRHGYDVELSEDLRVINVKEVQVGRSSGQAYR